MKVLHLTLVSAFAALFLLIGKPAHAVYTQTVVATGGQSFSGAQVSFTTATGEKGEVRRDPNDDNKIMILLPDGARGGSGTLSVTRGGQTRNIALSLTDPVQSVNISTGMARAARPRISNRYDISTAFSTCFSGDRRPRIAKLSSLSVQGASDISPGTGGVRVVHCAP